MTVLISTVNNTNSGLAYKKNVFDSFYTFFVWSGELKKCSSEIICTREQVARSVKYVKENPDKAFYSLWKH